MLKSKYENTKNEMDIWQQTKIFQMLREIPDSSLVNGGGRNALNSPWLTIWISRRTDNKNTNS